MGNYLQRLHKIISEQANGKHTLFAKKAGIPTSTFQFYVDGRLPSAKHLIRICKTYKININWLLTGEGEEYIQDIEGRTIDDDPEIAELLEGARRVLKSGNPVAFDALERNIRYFDHAVATEKRLEALEEKLDYIVAMTNQSKKDDATVGEASNTKRKVI